ncbi:hypothetical protein AD998_16375 [bacterium 336/3]|nr:hypothetical protein AD998_16375 [bacterium 336/3]
MQKIIYTVFACFVVLQACNTSKKVATTSSNSNATTATTKAAVAKKEEVSKKGGWNEQEKKKFVESCEAEIMALKDTPDGKTIQSMGVNIEEFAKKSCDCAIKKVEQNYENVTEASKDTEGLTKIGSECGGAVMKELMKK